MYNPPHFRETRADVLQSAIASHPLALLVTSGTSGLDASHLPLLYDPAGSPSGTLRGHLARGNRQWQETVPGSEALAIFSGPEHYITPLWYASTKDTGKAVPTWNYVTVHARGTLRFPSDAAWLLENVTALTNTHEKSLSEYSDTEAWRVEDAPQDYIEKMLAAIVGVELAITSIEGKWKVSQNRVPEDQEGAIAGLESLGTPESLHMAQLIKGAMTACPKK